MFDAYCPLVHFDDMLFTAYSSDAVYLYSTYDEPESLDSASPGSPPILPSNAQNEDKTLGSVVDDKRDHLPATAEEQDDDDEDEDGDDVDEDDDDEDEDDGDMGTGILIDDISTSNDADFLPDVPVVLPRMRYRGAQNVATVKDGRCPRECLISD